MKKTILSLAVAGLLTAPAMGLGDVFQFAANTADFENTQTVSQLYERLDDAVMEYCDRLVDRNQLVTCHDQVLTAVVDQFENSDLSAMHEQANSSDDSLELASRDDGV